MIMHNMLFFLIAPLLAVLEANEYTNVRFDRVIELPQTEGSLVTREIYEVTARCEQEKCGTYELEFGNTFRKVVWMDGAVVKG